VLAWRWSGLTGIRRGGRRGLSGSSAARRQWLRRGHQLRTPDTTRSGPRRGSRRRAQRRSRKLRSRRPSRGSHSRRLGTTRGRDIRFAIVSRQSGQHCKARPSHKATRWRRQHTASGAGAERTTAETQRPPAATGIGGAGQLWAGGRRLLLVLLPRGVLLLRAWLRTRLQPQPLARLVPQRRRQARSTGARRQGCGPARRTAARAERWRRRQPTLSDRHHVGETHGRR
jgi:hypothetical protein